MKALEKKVIVYDDECPMCSAYTNLFVKLGWIKEENRLAFSDLPGYGLMEQIDLEKARHFIPLIDLDGGETLYGVDALAYILMQRLFFIRIVMKIPGAEWFFKRLYKIISYNRRIVIPCNACTSKFDCAPD